MSVLKQIDMMLVNAAHEDMDSNIPYFLEG